MYIYAPPTRASGQHREETKYGAYNYMPAANVPSGVSRNTPVNIAVNTSTESDGGGGGRDGSGMDWDMEWGGSSTAQPAQAHSDAAFQREHEFRR